MRITKVFDPADGFAPLKNVVEVTDATVAKRGGRWWMFLAGQVVGDPGVNLFSASLPEGAPLSATGWTLTAEPEDASRIAMLAGRERSAAWDLAGGRHCPSYARGWDPGRGDWVERIYYAGSAGSLWGPYAIGYLEWDGAHWVDQTAPVFRASEEWERGSVYEPNVLYAEGKWRMWYAAGSNADDYIVQGRAESEDGVAWGRHEVVYGPDEKVFDFCAIPAADGYEAVFSRVWLGKGPAPERTGLWRTRSRDLAEWSEPVQMLTAEDRGWVTAPWKPSAAYEGGRLFVFFDGLYQPFTFTLGCLEIERA